MTYEQQKTSPNDLHAVPENGIRVWIMWLLPPVGNPFKIRVSVPAAYMGLGESAAVAQHCSSFYPDHLTGESWPTN